MKIYIKRQLPAFPILQHIMEYLFNNNSDELAGLNVLSPPQESSPGLDLTAFMNNDFFDLENTTNFNNNDFYVQQKQHAQQQIVKAEEDMQWPFAATAVSPPMKLVTSTAKAAKDVADEKRRRNTLASARFRIKKKMKEQMMEKELQELNKKVSGLQSTIQRLEMENRCLKELVVAKNEQKLDELLTSIKKNAGI